MHPLNTVLLKVVSAIAIAGEIIPASRPGRDGLSLVEVSVDEARDLLNRGKCEVPTDAELIEAGFLQAPPPADFDPPTVGDATDQAFAALGAAVDAAVTQEPANAYAVQGVEGTFATTAEADAAADAAQASQDAAQAATADAGTSDQTKAADAAQDAAKADKPATKPRGPGKSAAK